MVLPNGPLALPSASFAAPQFAFAWRAARFNAISASLCGPAVGPAAGVSPLDPLEPLEDADEPELESPEEPDEEPDDPEEPDELVVLDDESHFGAESSSGECVLCDEASSACFGAPPHAARTSVAVKNHSGEDRMATV